MKTRHIVNFTLTLDDLAASRRESAAAAQEPAYQRMA
jgi:hypothetical protein